MRRLTLLLMIPALGLTIVSACKEDPQPDPGPNVKLTYEFSDATAHNERRALILLADNLNSLVKSGRGNSLTAIQLLNVYEGTDPGVTPPIISSNSLAFYDQAYADSTRTQLARVAAMSGTAPATGYVADSLDLSQLTVKNIWGSAILSRLIALLDQALVADNSNAGNNYTDAEKAWDRAFGLSGFTPDALLYTKAERALPLKQKDTDKDGTLARRWETNYIFAHYAMRMDAENSWAGNFPESESFRFTDRLMNAFNSGRAALSNGNIPGARTEVNELKAMYETMVVAAIQHYLRVHQPFISNPAEQVLTGKRISNWSETVAFVNILDRMPGRKISDTQLATLRAYFGANPFRMDETARVNARNLLQDIYNFSTYQFENI
jgi:hypothetical protein